MNCLKRFYTWILIMVMGVAYSHAELHLELEFNHLTNRDGLSNGQVNAILQDDRGYVWLGTQSGLDRYDGFRFKNFFYKNLDASSLPNNSIDEVMQAINGDLWIHTSVGYCIYQYANERFDRNPEKWLKSVGIDGKPYKVFVDSNKNMWIVIYGKGCYFLNCKTLKHRFFSFRQMGLPEQKEVNAITEQKGTAVLSFRNGTLCRIDGLKGKVLWTNRYLTKTYHLSDEGAYTYIDHHNNYWVLSNSFVFVYSSANMKWYEGMEAFVKSKGISMPTSGKILVRDIAKGKDGKLWIATDHEGLFILDYNKKSCKQYVKRDQANSLMDNCLQKVYIDRSGAVWIGSYKNGIAYYSPSSTKFSTIDLGDICTITQDKWGNYWCGTNDAGIVCYNPVTGAQTHYGMAQTGLKSDIVVSSVTMQDGTMFFGTFNGGLARYRNGQWKTYNQSPHGLAHQSIWALCEDKHHRLVIGTLGGGLQFMDTQKETFKTIDITNSKIPTNYIGSLNAMPNGDILIGHSQNFSTINVDTYKFTNYNAARGGRAFPSPAINDVIMDSRGIIWMATPAGITMYDPNSGQMESVNDLNGTQGAVGCSVVEDQAKTIWLVSEFIVTHVKLSKDNRGKWELNMTSYNSMDGLQDRQFNYRSAFLSRNGDLVLGGQDGINIIHTQKDRAPHHHVKAMFSGLVLFDHPLVAGEEYEGRVVLEKSLDASRVLDLNYKDNAFTIQLSSGDVTVPSRNRFLYRMAGVTDKWLMTASGRPEVTFTNLSSGSYTLQVKVVNGDGTVCDEISELRINVHPPFYLSVWALMVYLLLACGAVYLYRKRALDRQKMIFEREKMEENIRKDRELNELKLNFFTNVSHELRTPLTLIISPLSNMIKNEENDGKKHKLELIYRNAERLLNLVNQILDFRKIEQKSSKLTLTQVEAVSYVEGICRSFQLLGNAKIKLVFISSVKELPVKFDVDKVGKIINNLLSNAYKFTPDGGTVTVSLDVQKDVKIKGMAKDVLRLKVADTGKGISDEDKIHIFDRFYQVNGTEMQPFGGSGIGLNLVKDFADLHGGTVTVSDNPGGGTIFTVDIPLQQDLDTSNIHASVLHDVVSAPEKTEAQPTSGFSSTTESSSSSATESSSSSATESSSSSAIESSSSAIESSSTKKTFSSTESSQKPKVLLVDDSDDFREFMNEILSDHYEVRQAVNGKEAWEILQTQPLPDVILSDVMMPVMDGNTLCRLVKGNNSTADIPFVMLTARLATEHQKEGLENGADEYITKPFDIDMLNLRIRNLMKWAKRKDASTAVSGGQGVDSANASQTGTSQADSSQAGTSAQNATLDEAKVVETEYKMTESDKKFIDTIDIYIRDNMGDPDTTVESMSAYLCISRVQLYKRMVSLTGTTPSEYLRAKRIHRAEELLREGELTVSEIAYKVGFNNPRYFSKYFQDEYGMTPSLYKKKYMS